MIFEQQNQKSFLKKISLMFLSPETLKNKFENKVWEKNLKNIFGNFFFQLQVTIPSAHPVQILSRSDYCIILS